MEQNFNKAPKDGKRKFGESKNCFICNNLLKKTKVVDREMNYIKNA